MPADTPGYVASGTIYPALFVKQDFHTTAPFSVLTAGVGDTPVGVSDFRVKYLPGSIGPGATAPIPAAEAGDPIYVVPPGGAGVLYTGAAVSAGQYLKPDSQGRGIPLDPTNTTTPQWYGARAEEFANAAGIPIRVTVMVGSQHF